MTVDELIISLLSDIAQVKPDFCKGTDTVYIAFNYDTYPVRFGDNSPAYDKYLVQIHFVCPMTGYDAVDKCKEIKRRLLKGGFTYPDMTNASDEYSQHYVFECEYTEAIEWQL